MSVESEEGGVLGLLFWDALSSGSPPPPATTSGSTAVRERERERERKGERFVNSGEGDRKGGHELHQ